MRRLLSAALGLLVAALPLAGMARPARAASAQEAAAPAATAASTAPQAASADDQADDDLFMDQPDPAQRDEIEPWNRRFFDFNEHFYRWVMDPVDRVFSTVVPQQVRDGMQHMFDNLGLTVVFANDLLQLAPLQAGQTAVRFFLNSTFGVLGIMDPATAAGIGRHDTDFGETLALYGTPSGTYLVIPIVGPSTARDATGELVDLMLRPDFLLLGLGPAIVVGVAGGITSYDEESAKLDALRSSSVDFYAALRAAYLMNRDAKVRKRFSQVWWARGRQPVDP
jgi:phospholipid-binding lipoprotein MlaA